MIAASEIRAGMVVKLDGELYRIIQAEYHAGGGQFGGTMFAKAENLQTRHIKEWRFHPDQKVEDVELERQEMEFLYSDGEDFYFMNPETFEQISLPREVIGHREKFLQANMRIPVEIYNGNPVNVVFPEFVDLKVISAPPGLREHDVSTYKTAVLENGMEVLVPQFIKEGEIVRIEVETGKYVERVKQEGRKV
ncbi:MAG TPA: elongation factor P [Blastocatellia bacterium]|nr:elongation factor P [Blastocatellia bacterium]